MTFVMLSMLDGLYGNLFDVVFGLCKKDGIHLERSEVRKVLEAKSALGGRRRWSRGKGGAGVMVRDAALIGKGGR